MSCSAPVVIDLQGAPARIPAGQLDRQKQQLRLRAEKDQQPVPDVKEWPTTFPWYLALATDTLGNLWVDRNWNDRGVEVYSSKGTLVGHLAELAPGMSTRPMVITADHLYGLSYGTDGTSYLVAYKIVKG